MKKAMSLCGVIVLLMLILPLLAGVVTAEPIIIDTEKGVSGFRTEPARDLPANWQYVHDHPDTSADGWFDTNAYPPGQGNGSFWYTISFPDMGECKGIWETSVPYTGKYEVFVWIPSPDSFDPYLDESTPPSDYLPTKHAPYKVFHNDGVATVTIDQNEGGFTSLGVFVFDSTARVELSSNGVEFWRCVAFDAVKFVPVVNDMAVTDVSIIPPLTSVGQSTAICVTVTNEGTQQEENVSVKAFVDGAQVGSTKYVSLDPGASDTTTILWIPKTEKGYSVRGEVWIVSGETDTEDNTRTVEVVCVGNTNTVATPAPSKTQMPTENTYPLMERFENYFAQVFSAMTTIWERTYDSGDGGALYGLAIDSENNIIVTGVQDYWTTAQADWVTLKYTADGDFLWLRTYDSGTWEAPFAGLAIDAEDNVFVAGNPSAANQYDYHIAKYNLSGGYLWNRIFDTGANDLSTSIVTDSQGNVLIIGYQHAQYQSTFVKYDLNGSFLWSKTYPIYFETGEVKLDGQENIVLGGMTYSADTGVDYYVAKLNSEGTVIWQRTYNSGGTAYDYGYAVAIDSQDNIIVTGDRITRKYDTSGNVLWTINQTGTDIALDSNDNIFVITGPEIVKCNTTEIVKLDSTGNLLWNYTLTGYLKKIVIDNTNDIVVAGTTSPPDLWGSHDNDFLIRKLREVATLNVSIIAPPEGFCTFSGSELIVKAKVLDEEEVLYNATVTGKMSSFSFTLYDDGLSTHGDDVKDDGIYSAKITVPKIPNAVLKINARHDRKFGSASRSITIDTAPEQPLKVEAEIIEDNPPTFSGDTVKVRAVVSLNGVIVNDAEVKSTIIYPNSYQKNITLQNKGDYYEADFDWLFQGGEYTFDVVAYPKENAIPGYDTKKLKVYHGSLSITQEDTGTIFKKGEPVDFKVEVTCSGLTCPDKVNNAEVRMEILPDDEEIGLVGIGDGVYQAIYTFTSPGVRDITFSASAPFCIPAEINGNSIEVKEEDYELKKAVEDFADDNINTLETTKSSAADLSITGDYFFCKIEEEATERIASLIAKPLAFFTTDVLFPSMDFRTWYGEILGRSLEELSNTVLENVYYNYLLEYKQESSSPFLPHELRSYIELVNKFEDDITKIEEDTLSNFASIPEDQKPLYLQDLNNRQKANSRIKDLISKEVNFPYSVYKARLAEDTGWEKDFIEDIGVAIVGILYPPAGLAVGLGKTVLDTCETVNNLEEDGRLVTITSETFSDMYVKSKKIKENTVSGISQFKHAIPPVMPEIEVLPIQDFYKGGYVHVSGAGTIWFETEKECYTLIEVRNTGTTQADIWVVAYFPNVIDGGRKSLKPGECGIFRIDYVNPYFEYKPEEGNLVTFLIFSERNDNSIYLVKEVWRIFSPIPVSEYASETSKECCLANSNNQKESENLTIISYPIETSLARVNMTTYEVIITARNPFAYPINANITQNTSTWNVSIPSRETKTLNYTIHPELGVETTIPQAYMEYFDFQHNVTVTFASDAINFTAYGIEINGDLPYEINEYVEVNLSITNLVNVTNGTFCLELIGNETFDYNVTASIENDSTYTVMFGPIDVPEGHYIGISTFVWDDEKLTIDTRNMIKAENKPPTANFTYLPLHPVVNHTVTFNASNSTDPDGNITKYDWEFGDVNITNTTEEIINHSYLLAGDYIVNLTVTDNNGSTNSISKTIYISNLTGCYIGAYLGCGSEDLSCESILEFNHKMGKNHTIFVRYVDIKDSKNPSHWEWAEEVKRNSAMPMFIYDPYDGLNNINTSDVEYFAPKCKEFNETVFIVFGHEMNGPWYPWGNDPENYTNKFKEVAEIFHREAPKVEMCWVPNQNWGYPWGGTNYGDGYSEYYPEGIGAYGEYVDWVGLNFYDRDWDEDNVIPPDMFVANIRNGQSNTDFYELFAAGKNKSMLIAETGAFDPNKDQTAPGVRNPLNETEEAEFKSEWLTQVYNISTLKGEFTRLNAICYFHVEKRESIDSQTHSFYDIEVDYRIPESPNVYKDLISDSYFLSSVITNPDLIITEKWLCWPDNCTICYNVTNIGTGTAPACHNTTLYVDGVAVAHDHVPVDLAPGESYTGCFIGYEWTYTPPSDEIRVCADNSEALDELEEGNNCLSDIWMCGDVNCDGKVTMSDVRKVFNRYLDLNYPLDLPWAADVNCDGKVTMSDVRKVFNRYLDPGYDMNCCCK